jgi:hypothetical protein
MSAKLRRLRKNYCGTQNFDGPHVWHNRRTPRRIAARQAEVEAKAEAEAQMRIVRSLLSLNLNLSLLQAGGLF